MNTSIEDLLGKKKKAANPSDPTTQEQFAKKMEDIDRKEKEAEVQKKAASLGLSYLSLAGFPISPEALQLIPREQAEEHRVVAFLYNGKEVRIGAVDPIDPAVAEIVSQVAESTHAHVGVYMVSEHSFGLAVKFYDTLPTIKVAVKGVQLTQADLDKFSGQAVSLDDLSQRLAKVSVTDFLSLAIAAAINAKVSDIHIEAEEKQVVVRFRIDGILHDIASVPPASWPRIVSRVKLLSGLKLSLTTAPQDGRFTIFIGQGKDIDVRVSTLPTTYGESIVMRLLMPGTIGLGFDELGIRGKAFEQLKKEIERPNGMIVTTGPTGSGKTTTLYAILKKLDDPETKIITLEDPIEYRLERINQSQIDKSKDYTFAKGLTSILRQDPDTIMVGEIRDLETAEVAIQASLTGHLLLSTIHTNSAAGAVPRFLSMGVKPFLLAPALNAVIGQRLVRKVHDACKTDDAPDPALIERAKKILGELSPNSGYSPDLGAMKFSKGKGCDGCNGIGYKGRVGVYEIFVMSKEIEKIILGGQVSEYDMQAAAIQQGMITMVQDGILKALDGITTLDEVFRVAE